MSAKDLAQGLRAIDEEDVRQKVAAGDLAAAGDLDLTEEEAGLLQGAADDYPEVAGFFFDVFFKPVGFEAAARKALGEFEPGVRPGAAVRPGRSQVLTGTAVDAEVWAALGAALRREAGAAGGPLVELVGGNRRPVVEVREGLGEPVFDALLRGGVLELEAGGTEVACRLRMLCAPEFVVAAPDADTRPDMVYIGPDSGLLVEAALRLAPRGERAVDLGTGTGLLAAALSRRYRCVVATDIVRRVAAAARCTMMLNDRPPGHVWLTAQTDVTCGLRTRSFDLVAANTPWVPASVDADTPVGIYANGGRDGLELPARFLVEGAALLRPGGVAVLLALHVVRSDGARPLSELCGNLEQEGYSVAVVPTPLNRTFPQLSTKTLARCPDLVEAIHVAVVIGAPVTQGDRRDSLLVACDALARRWQTETLCLGVMAA